MRVDLKPSWKKRSEQPPASSFCPYTVIHGFPRAKALQEASVSWGSGPTASPSVCIHGPSPPHTTQPAVGSLYIVLCAHLAWLSPDVTDISYPILWLLLPPLPLLLLLLLLGSPAWAIVWPPEVGVAGWQCPASLVDAMTLTP